MKALLVIDIQNDFLPGGALEVKDGDQIISVINKIMKKFDWVIATKDWHPADHKSFASQHEGKSPGEMIKLKDIDQVLWPDHCIQGTVGAEFSKEFDLSKVKNVFEKGTEREIDSYSGFFDNGHLKSTGLNDYLRGSLIDEVFIVGLATDYCVKFTVLDSIMEGFKTYVIADATKAVNLKPNDYETSLEEMKQSGAVLLNSQDLLSD
jgi:nicotinamidase/pyrazinamidase